MQDFFCLQVFHLGNSYETIIMCHTDKIYIKIYRNMLFFYYLTFIFSNKHILTFLYILHKFCQVFILYKYFILIIMHNLPIIYQKRILYVRILFCFTYISHRYTYCNCSTFINLTTNLQSIVFTIE